MVVQGLLNMFLWIFFTWKLINKSQADTAAKLSNHIQLFWNQCFTTKLSEWTFNGNNVDIAGLLFLPYFWNSRWLSLISGISDVPDILHFHIDSYRDFICEFFENKLRSGKYHIDGTVYAHAALECLRNMVNPNDE
jgi:hypothetical protein